MTAKEARLLMPENNLKEILRFIEVTATQGNDYTYYYLSNDSKDALLKLGYTVEYYKEVSKHRISW